MESTGRERDVMINQCLIYLRMMINNLRSINNNPNPEEDELVMKLINKMLHSMNGWEFCPKIKILPNGKKDTELFKFYNRPEIIEMINHVMVLASPKTTNIEIVNMRKNLIEKYRMKFNV